MEEVEICCATKRLLGANERNVYGQILFVAELLKLGTSRVGEYCAPNAERGFQELWGGYVYSSP